MTPEKKEWVTKELVSEFKELTKSGITDIELQLVKSRMIKSQKRLMQRSEDWVNFHYYGESLSPENNWRFDEYLSELESLTVNDINETIKKYIDVTKLYIISVGK